MNLSTITESLLGIFGEKKGKLVWNGSLKDLKTFISTIIEEKAAESAIWRSPSGGKWCFISDVLGVTWYAKSKTICFDGPKADDLVVRIQDALARLDSVLEVNNDDLSFEENIVEDPICINENEVSNCSGVIAAEMEGIKLDMSILEGRFANAIKENKSDIGLLQRQLKELEGIIRHQDEVICKLSEDNLVLKSKLSAIENLTPKVTYYEHKDNKYANESVSLIPVNDQSTSQVIDQSTRSNINNLKPIDNLNIDHLTPNESHDYRNNKHVNDLASSTQVIDKCTSHGVDQLTNLNTNNPSPIEITINEDSSLLDNTQLPDPSVNQYSKADLTLKPKEANDMLRDKNKALNPKFDNEPNINSEKNRHLNPEKGITPCPFLKRRGWCVKGARCDFKHPRDVQKHLVPCPFLQKRGFCLKGDRCDFSHSFSYPYRSLPSRPVNKYITPSLFHHDRPTVVSQGATHEIGVNQFPQNYPRQGFFQLYPKPLMDIPIQPPLPHAFYNHPCYRTLYAETLV